METKPRKELTSEQIEVLKARLMKARETKLNRKRIDYVKNKEDIKEEGLKKRTLKKIQSLVEKGTVKEDELINIIPKKEAVQQIPVEKIVQEISNETINQKPLPTKKQILNHKMIEDNEPTSQPIDIPRKNKDRFMKLVYYKEPSKKTMKKLEKIQESSSSDDSSDTDEEIEKPTIKSKTNDENEYYRNLAKLLYF